MAEQLLQGIDVPPTIAKDECIYCYETPFNNAPGEGAAATAAHALNVCLHCFQAVCGTHRELHMGVTQHSCDAVHTAYLNVAKVEKPRRETPEETASKKIKLQVTEKSEDELYDTLWKLVQCSDDTEQVLLEGTSTDASATPPKITQILRAKSKELADQASSWELEIHTCEHSRNFDPESVPEAPIDTSKCRDCELTENLWLCLHCGNIGCGRDQVGIEGHSHGLGHYNTHTDHCLAIKLGSLSKNSSDLYCYKCDDEVKFSDDNVTLAKVLARFGIDVASKTATEKTLTELQVEQNMNWDFKMTDAQGNELVKLNPNDELGCGLLNLGNSCYLNSVVQCLFNDGVPQWAELLAESIGFEFPLDVVYPDGNLKCQLIKLNNALRVDPDHYPQGIKPRSFKKCVAGSHEEFCSGRQQDAMEFLAYMISQLDTKYFDKATQSDNTVSNPNDLFRFSMEDRLQCQNCGKVKYTYGTEEAIQVPLVEDDSAQDLVERLGAYFSGETLEFTCPSCKEHTTASKRMRMKTFPNTLVVSPVRVKLVNWTPVKTSNELAIPGLDNWEETLDVSEYTAQGFDEATEQLLEDAPEPESASAFVPDAGAMSQLLEMGFTENAIKRALYATGNNPGSGEVAMNWLFGHMEDADLNTDFEPAPASTDSSSVDAEALGNMVAMGLSESVCHQALKLNQGDVNRSVEWVFAHPDGVEKNTGTDGGSNSQAQDREYGQAPDASGTRYRLQAVVCHKGNSAHSGHYVAFIRKHVSGHDTPQWVLYNDEKIVLAGSDVSELRTHGYMYFYARV
ncbi:ubiquitin-specific protease [Maudiozyma humilis]|uniref:Ubiquitin carboxyl-terminal hydrolase n=1 Tax=Maudiozyma humilis TaxID=51915 RepID=A0AAV5RVQ2_MAUHU|nr:ubiquitin-specific protease [Kazachstania humilis]